MTQLSDTECSKACQGTLAIRFGFILASMITSTNSAAGSKLICTVDVVLLTLCEGQLRALLLRREREPFAGTWGPSRRLRACRRRSGAARMPRSESCGKKPAWRAPIWSNSPASADRLATRGAGVCRWPTSRSSLPQKRLCPTSNGYPWTGCRNLPFDHGTIVATAVERVRSKSQYSSLPVHLCPEPFTISQLHAVYETLLGEPINTVSFRRKLDELAILEPVVGAKRTEGAHRPAQLYRVRAEFRQRLRLVGRGLNR